MVVFLTSLLLIALLILTQNVMCRVKQVLIADCLASQSGGSAFGSHHHTASRLPIAAFHIQVTVHRFLLSDNIFLGLLSVDDSAVHCGKGRNSEVGLCITPPLIYNQRVLWVDVDSVRGGRGALNCWWPVDHATTLAAFFPMEGVLVEKWVLGRLKDRRAGYSAVLGHLTNS